MILGDRFLPKIDVTFGANKLGILPSLINLIIQNPAVIDRLRDVTTFGSSTGSHRNFERIHIDGVETCAGRIVADQATKVGMLTGFMSERAG